MRLIGLDVGTKRIGVAKADTSTRIAVPDGFVNVNGQEFSEIARIARLYDANTFVVGLPRNNQGEETDQSIYVRKFAHNLAKTIPGTRIYFQDESLTSVEAERRLKSRKQAYTRGDIDAEAAAIILQDCIEHFASRATNSNKADIGDIWSGAKEVSPKNTKKTPGLKTGKTIAAVILALLIVLGCSFLLANHWYNDQLRPAHIAPTCDQTSENPESIPEGCRTINFTVTEAASVSDIAKALEDQDLIRSALAFRIYVSLNGYNSLLKAGEYGFRSAMSTPEIVDFLARGATNGNVFSFTILPGESLSSIKANLLTLGYEEEAIENAFSKNYSDVSHELKSLLATKPADVSLEGYLYGETYEFYKDESVENIIIRAMEQLYYVVTQNNLIAAYDAQGLTLHEGLTLASMVQKEAISSDQAGVARVFFNRLHQGFTLGSDVTTQYAADLLDPERKTYTDNAAIIEIDSPYNTRKYTGLPPGPICTPGLSALLAVAQPADSDYLYFLTGDDGVIYYSYTEDEHLQNISDHCQALCNTQL